MQNIRDEIHKKLLKAGRVLVCEKGADFLTARKLSEASGCSIGTIYNQFSSMDDFVAEQNEQTLSELLKEMSAVQSGDDSYKNLNRLADVFIKFVLENRQLWFLLYNFHFRNGEYNFSRGYKKILLKVLNFANRDFYSLFPKLDRQRKKTIRQVLLLALSGLSAVLTSELMQKKSSISGRDLVQIFLNVFLAGTSVLEDM
jgi:AcrR family transcriptional regulator